MGDKARRNLHFKSQRMLSAGEGGWNQDGRAGRCLWRWVRTWQQSRSCLPPGNCLEQGRRLVLCCPGVSRASFWGHSGTAAGPLVFQRQFWLLLILSWSCGGSFRGGWVGGWEGARGTRPSGSLREVKSCCLEMGPLCHTPVPALCPLAESFPGEWWVKSRGHTDAESEFHTGSAWGLQHLSSGQDEDGPFHNSHLPPFLTFLLYTRRKSKTFGSLFFGRLLKTNKNPFIVYLFGLKISKTTT